MSILVAVASITVLFLAALPIVYYFVLPLCLRLLGSHLLRRSSAKRDVILGRPGASEKSRIVGFFHPYCNAGGGGERVLWAAIHATQKQYPEATSVVYTGDHDATKDDILSRVQTRFSISLDPDRIIFLYLSTRRYVAPTTWPRFTLIGQSIGSLILAWDAFTLLVPDVFIDTAGYAFTFPLAKALFDIPTAAYVHYPTISTDMLESLPADSTLHTRLKRTYWKAFAAIYKRCGNSIDRVMVNSTWTENHIRALWSRDDITLVYPPCSVTELLQTITDIETPREKLLITISQFRPEKKHNLVIESFAHFHRETKKHKDAKLVLIGSVRNSEDATRVYELRLLARELGVNDHVEFVTDAPWKDVVGWLQRAWIGVNAMWNEHFGIGVVEYQAAGLVGVVHDSGGPKMDIVVEGTGYHCTSKEEFAAAFQKALDMDEASVLEMRRAARRNASRFDEETFENHWAREFGALMM